MAWHGRFCCADAASFQRLLLHARAGVVGGQCESAAACGPCAVEAELSAARGLPTDACAPTEGRAASDVSITPGSTLGSRTSVATLNLFKQGEEPSCEASRARARLSGSRPPVRTFKNKPAKRSARKAETISIDKLPFP